MVSTNKVHCITTKYLATLPPAMCAKLTGGLVF